MNKKKCWICKRTPEEVFNLMKESEAGYEKPDDTFNEFDIIGKNFEVCTVCNNIIENIFDFVIDNIIIEPSEEIENMIKKIIRDSIK